MECGCCRIHRYVAAPKYNGYICTTALFAGASNNGAGNEWGNVLGRFNKPVLEFLNNLWGARNRVGIGLSYRPTRLHRLAEFILGIDS
jgi:hypothetical protein